MVGFKLNNQIYDIPEELVDQFKSDNPDAVLFEEPGKIKPTPQQGAETVDVITAPDTDSSSEGLSLESYSKIKANTIKDVVGPYAPYIGLLPDSLVNSIGGLVEAVVDKPIEGTVTALARPAGEALSFIPGAINFVETAVELNAQVYGNIANALFNTDFKIDPKKDRIPTKFLDNIVNELRTYGAEKDEDGNALDSLALWEKGRYGDAAEQFTYEAVGSLPYTAITWLAPGYGSAAIGIKTFGEEFERNVIERPEESAEMMALNAGLKGTAEILYGFIGGSIGRKITKFGAKTSGAEKLVKEITGKWVPKVAKQMFYGGATEGFEEALTSVSQMGADVLTFDENYTPEQYIKRALHAAALGAVTGAPTSAAMGAARRKQIKKTGLSFIANADWRRKQYNLTQEIDKLALEYDKAPENQKEYFKEKIRKRQELQKRRQDKLVEDWDKLTDSQKLEYGRLLTEVDNKSDIAFGRSYSKETRAEAKEELNEIYSKMGELIGMEVDIEKEGAARTSEALLKAAKETKGDIEFAQRAAEAFGYKFSDDNIISTVEEVEKRFGKEAANSAGFVDPKTNEIFINQQMAVATRDISVGSHEVLHGILNVVLKGEGKEKIINDFKANLTEEQRSVVDRRIEEGNYSKEYLAKNPDEYITQFYNAVVDNEITYKENALTKVGDFFTNLWRQTPFGEVKFNTGEDIYNFIKDYKKARKKGVVDRATIKAAKVFADKKTIGAEAKADINNFQRSSGEDIQKIYDEQGVAGAMDIINAYKPLTTKLTNKYRNVPGFDFELLQSEIELGKRGLLDLIQAYNPSKGATINTYIQGQLTRRTIEAANRVLDTEFTEDVTEAKKVTATETADEIVERKEKPKPKEKVSLRKQLGLDETIKPTVVTAVKKTFGTKLPKATSKEFRPELEKRFRTELKKPLAKLMGRTEDYRSFLANNFEVLYEAIPQYVINRRFNAFAEPMMDKDGKQLREKTAEGKKIFTKKKIVKAEWLKYFLGDDVGRSTQGTRKTALAEALAEQFAYDATMEVLADTDVVEKIKGISELTGQQFSNNYLDEVSNAIERPTNFKFSLSTKIVSDWSPSKIDDTGWSYSFTVKDIEYKSMVFDEPDFEYEIFEGTFGLEDGTLANDPKSLLLSFAEDATGSTEILGTATEGLTSAFQVFGTVANSAVDLIKKEKLNSIAFTAKEKSRVKLYNALANKFSKELGWENYNFQIDDDNIGYIVYNPKILKEAEETNISKDVLKFSKSEIFDVEGNKVLIKDQLEDIFNISAKAANFNAKTPFNKLEKEFLKYTNNNFKLADGTSYDAKVYRSILFEYYTGKLVEFYNPNIKLANSFNGFSSAGIGDLTFESKETGEKIYAEIKMTGRAGIYPQMGGGGISVDLKKGEISEAEKGKKIPMFNYIKEALNKDGYSKTLIDILNKIGVKNIGKFTKEQVKEFDKIINKSKKEGKGNPLLKNINLGNTDNIVKGYAEQGVDIIISGNDVSNIVMHSLNNKNFGLDMPTLKGEGIATVRFTWASKSKGNATIRVINNIKGKTINEGAPLQEVRQLKFSKSRSREFNELLQATTGIEWYKTYSPVKARLAGKGKGRKFFIPYSADDFVGLLYTTLGKGKVGDQQMQWYEDNLLRPFSRGIQRYEAAKQKALRDWMMLKKEASKNVPGGLRKTNSTGFTNQNSVRLYIWNKQGMDVPGMGKKDLNDNLKIVNNNPALKEFAERLIAINPEGYPEPSKNWDSGDITTDLVSYINDVRRGEFLTEWKENVDEIFSDANKNKLRALYGERYVEALEDILHRMKTGRNRKFGINKVERAFMDWTNNSVGAIMFFNARSAVLQTLSSINFINFSDNNPINAALAFANQKQYWKDFSTLFNSDFLKQRRTGLQTDVNADEIANAAATSENKAKAVLSAILKFGFTPTQIADSFAIASGGASMYRNRIKKYIKEGGKVEEELVYNASPKSFDKLGERTGLIYLATNKREAKAYADMNRGTVKNIYINKNQVASEKDLISTMEELGINTAEGSVYELIDPRFDNFYIGKDAMNKVTSALAEKGFKAAKYEDGAQVVSGKVESIVVFDKSVISDKKGTIKSGMTQKQAEAKAFTDFQEIAEETQQSARPDRISSQQAGSLGRLILAFGNTPMQYARLTKKAALDLINGRGDWKTNISKITYYSVIQNIIFSSLQSGLFALLFDEEDEDEEKSRLFRVGNSSIDTLLRGLGVYGAAAATVKNMILKIIEENEKSRPDYRKAAIEATSISPPINSKLRKLLSAGSTFTYKQSKEKVFTEGFSLENPAFLAAGKVISAGTNLPADRVVQKADHIYTAMQPETELWQAIALSLGWSEWDLGMIEKQTKKAKNARSLKRKTIGRKTIKRKTIKR